jgi:hypothetical protein
MHTHQKRRMNDDECMDELNFLIGMKINGDRILKKKKFKPKNKISIRRCSLLDNFTSFVMSRGVFLTWRLPVAFALYFNTLSPIGRISENPKKDDSLLE